MASKMKNSFGNMVIVLGLVAGIASVSLGFVYELTKAPIAKAQADKLKKAIAMVAPEFDELKELNVAPADNLGDSLIFYELYKGDDLTATAIKTWTDKGFGGRVWAIVCFLPDGTINNSNVLIHTETPGLGDKTDIKNSNWNQQFKDKNPEDFKLSVTKDGGDVNAITAATISSRAYCDAMQRAYDAFIKHQSGASSEEVLEAEPQTEVEGVPNMHTIKAKRKGGKK